MKVSNSPQFPRYPNPSHATPAIHTCSSLQPPAEFTALWALDSPMNAGTLSVWLTTMAVYHLKTVSRKNE